MFDTHPGINGLCFFTYNVKGCLHSHLSLFNLDREDSMIQHDVAMILTSALIYVGSSLSGIH